MIKFNEEYSINNGQLYITFEENGGKVIGHYAGSRGGNEGMVNGDISGDILSGSWQVKAKGAAGLLEIEFNESGFEGKWKQGLEPGAMKGVWTAVIADKENLGAVDVDGFEEYFDYVGKAEFVLEHSLPIEGAFFKPLLEQGVRFLTFSFPNSDEAIDEHDADEEWEVVFDVETQSVLPNDHYSVTEDEEWLGDSKSELIGYFKTGYISIPENCRALGKWVVPFAVGRCGATCPWYLRFHGGFEEVTSGSIDEALLDAVKAEMSEEVVFDFVRSVLRAVRGY